VVILFINPSNPYDAMITPHVSSAGSWMDPTHIHHLSCFSMNHFAKADAVIYHVVCECLQSV